MLSLVIFKKGLRIESSDIAWEDNSCSKIMPKRDPDLVLKGIRYWIIAPDRRAAFCRFANKVLDEHGTVKESLYGFFGIVGIADRYLKDENVEWNVIFNETSECGL